MRLLKRFLPSKYVKSIFEIHPEQLIQEGIKGIITDLDNTLVSWDRKDATPEVIQWFRVMEEKNIKVTIMSNNNEERVKKFSEPLNTPFIYSARKPMSKSFIRAQRDMDLLKEDIVVIGDQLLTDVLGGNSAGFKTILVVPIVQTDEWMTRINRKIERRILQWMKNKGMLTWEE